MTNQEAINQTVDKRFVDQDKRFDKLESAIQNILVSFNIQPKNGYKAGNNFNDGIDFRYTLAIKQKSILLMQDAFEMSYYDLNLDNSYVNCI